VNVHLVIIHSTLEYYNNNNIFLLNCIHYVNKAADCIEQQSERALDSLTYRYRIVKWFIMFVGKYSDVKSEISNNGKALRLYKRHNS